MGSWADHRERFEAYRQTLIDHGITPDPALFFEAVDNVQSGGGAPPRLLIAAGLPSTAVLTGTDFNAIGLLGELTAAGYRLPGDQAVIGFDGVSLRSPRRASTGSPCSRSGRSPPRCCWGPSTAPARPGAHVVATTFVPRESCGCVPTGIDGDRSVAR